MTRQNVMNWLYTGSSHVQEQCIPQRLHSSFCWIMFTGYIELRNRSAYPQMDELPYLLERTCREMSFPHVGKIQFKQDYGKLRTSQNHLNDHVLHVNYEMLCCSYWTFLSCMLPPTNGCQRESNGVTQHVLLMIHKTWICQIILHWLTICFTWF